MMGVYAVWPFFVCLALMLAFAASPLFKPVDPPAQAAKARIAPLDGMRGFLALSVYFHHAAIYHRYLLDGAWQSPPSRFYAVLGQVGVAMFFIVTGYLFWGRILREDGRPDFRRLYIGRIFRIGPLYLCAVAVLVAIVFSHTGLRLNDPPLVMAKVAMRWLALGLFGRGPDINEYHDTNNIVAGVTWTLRYEWMFYASLLLTAWLARIRRGRVVLCAVALAGCLAYVACCVPPVGTAPRAVCAALFLAGMLAASLQQSGRSPPIPPTIASVLALLLVGSVLRFFPNANAALPVVLLGAAFFLIIQGGDLFGLLSSTAARRLGDISYGIYLLQGLVLALVLSPVSVRTYALGSPAHHWLTMGGCAACLVAVAAMMHVAVERPGIALGRVVARWLRAREADPAAPRDTALASRPWHPRL